MCIIVAKPAGVDIPSDTVLSNCFDGNPDGAGMAYARDGQVVVVKGLMELEDVYAALANEGIGKDTPMVLHFRWATSGRLVAENTHPFPITGNVKEFRMLRWSGKVPAIAHNGVIGLGEKEWSDTAVFVRDMLADPFVFPRLKQGDKRCLGFVEKLAKGDKFAIMMPNGKTHLIGKFIEDSGVWYSNNGYLYAPIKFASMGAKSGKKGKTRGKTWWKSKGKTHKAWAADEGWYMPDEMFTPDVDTRVDDVEINEDDLMWDETDNVGYSMVDERVFAYDAEGALREVVYDAEINDFRFV